jgi:hypothetical protein
MTLRNQAQAALAGPGVAPPTARAAVPARPGLYAVYGDAAAWEQLGLGRPPDRRPYMSARPRAAWPAVTSASTSAPARPGPRPYAGRWQRYCEPGWN